jgi:hypothetical protein
MHLMRQRDVPIVLSQTGGPRDAPLPVWLCAAVILGISAGCYYLLFRLISALGLW